MATSKSKVTPSVESTPQPASVAPVQEASVQSRAESVPVQSQTVDIAAVVKAAIEATQSSNAEASQSLAQAITEGISKSRGIRRIGIGELVYRTPFNPTGKKRTLEHDFYHNGFPIKEVRVSDDEIEFLHKITPGVFLDGFVKVIERKTVEGRKVVHIIHEDNPTARLNMKSIAPNFHLLLVALVNDAKAQKAQKKAEARQLLMDDES